MKPIDQNRMLTFLVSSVVATLVLLPLSPTFASTVAPQRLRCEYLIDPLGIDTAGPRLSWELRAVDPESRGLRQSAYQVQVASSAKLLARGRPDLWDGGKVKSDETVGIVYAGKKLASGDDCHWRVRVWDQEDEPSAWSQAAIWSVGLLSDDAWTAKWITAPEFLPDSPKHVGFMSEPTKDADAAKWVQIDLGEEKRIDGVRLHPACGRRGVHPPGGEVPPGDGFPVRFKVEASSNEDMRDARTLAAYVEADVPNPGTKPFLIRFAASPGRYVRLTAVKHGNFARFQGRQYYLKLAGMEVLQGEEDVARGRPVSASDSTEDISEGYGASLLTAGKTGYDAGQRRRLRPAPLLRGEFACDKPVRRATAYATALGNYELHINGARVGDPHLAPGYTQYDKRVAVQAYDVTAFLREGSNAAGAVLADGWYRSRYRLDGYDQFKDFAQGRFGDAIPRVLLQIEVEYKDGSRDVFGTDASWTCTLDGPYRKTSMYDGVIYDARREIPHWSEPGTQLPEWAPVVVSEPSWKLIRWPQTVQPIACVAEFKPVSVEKTPHGTWICDFGQGVGGVCRVTLDGPAGMTMRLRHAMALNPDGTLHTRSCWGASNNADVYILKGQGPQTFQAPFTYHGFRYVEISGMESAENLVDIAAMMISDQIPVTAELETSDPRLNKLWNALIATYQSCMKSSMADVADRDERWGWMGDCQTTHAQSMAYLFDIAPYYRKRCLDLKDDQDEEGYFPPKSPAMAGGGPSAIWSDGALTMAWAAWLNYADKRLLSEIYPAVREYVWMLKAKYESEAPLWPGHFGDWLSSQVTIRPDAKDWQDRGPAQIPKHILQRLTLIHDARLMERFARVLGREEDAAEMSTFCKKLMADPVIRGLRNKAPATGAQSAYALSLGWDAALPSETDALVNGLVAAIEAYNGHLTTGTPSTTTLLNVLSANGRHDLAWQLVLKPEFPSFGFMVDNGATVLWERFDTYHPRMGFNPEPMNGLNHVGFCSVADWLFVHIAGIRPDPAQPGYKHFFIEPKLGGGLTSMKASYNSVRGHIESAYEIKNGELTLRVTIPPNTSATVILPDDSHHAVESGQFEITIPIEGNT
jgi:alpha-L-rhamnosidase